MCGGVACAARRPSLARSNAPVKGGDAANFCKSAATQCIAFRRGGPALVAPRLTARRVVGASDAPRTLTLSQITVIPTLMDMFELPTSFFSPGDVAP